MPPIGKASPTGESSITASALSTRSAILGLQSHCEFSAMSILREHDSQHVQVINWCKLMQTRNVDRSAPIRPFPAAATAVVERMETVPDMPPVDQLTVNEYPPGVGLAPHVDTHSAFTGKCQTALVPCCLSHSTRSNVATCTAQMFMRHDSMPQLRKGHINSPENQNVPQKLCENKSSNPRFICTMSM